MMHYSERGRNWCGKYGHEIDDELVREHKDDCVKENNGCGNCVYVCYHIDQVFQEGCARMRGMELSKKQRKTLASLEKAFKRCARDGIILFASDSLLAMTEKKWGLFEIRDATEISNDPHVVDVDDYGAIVDRGAP